MSQRRWLFALLKKRLVTEGNEGLYPMFDQGFNSFSVYREFDQLLPVCQSEAILCTGG